MNGLRRDDLFMVVHELFATDTVDYADIVLPATSQLEHVDIHGSYGHLDVMYNPPAIAPRGECRSNNDVFRALARRLGFEPELFPDDETLIRQVLDGGPSLRGITLERLKDEGSVRLNLPERLRPVRRRRLPDAVGQVRALLGADEGRRPRPAAHLHSAARRPADASRPGGAVSACSSSARPGPSFSTRRSPTRPAIAPPPAIRRSSSRPKMPQMRGLSDGQWAEVYNDRGRFQARVALTGSVRPGVAVATGIYWNKLTPGRWQRQQHDVVGPDRHGGRGDVF